MMWVEALESGDITEPVWTDWAEKQTGDVGQPQLWLKVLCHAPDTSTALSVLYSTYLHDSELAPYDDRASASLGFLYLRYLRGELQLATLLLRAGGEADGYNYDHPSCEEIYALLNQLEAAIAQVQNIESYVQEATVMFDRHRDFVEIWLASVGYSKPILGVVGQPY